MRSSPLLTGLIVISTMMLCSCSTQGNAPKLSPVEGIVTWNGQPLADAAIAFTPSSGPIAVGKTDAEGRFRLSTQGRPGAAVGAHRITIQAYEPLPANAATGPDGESTVNPVSRIPEKFGQLDQSGLTATVSTKAGENKFTFDLK